MQSCKTIFLELLFRLGAGLVVVAVIVFVMILFNSAPQTGADVTGDSIRIVEGIYLVFVGIVGDPVLAAIVSLTTGLVMILLALIMDSVDKKESG